MTCQLLRDLLRRGVKVQVNPATGRLVIDAPAGVVTDDDLAGLRENKAAIVDLLTRADEAEASALALLDRIAGALRSGVQSHFGSPAQLRVLDAYREAVRSCRASLDMGLFFAYESVRLLALHWGIRLEINHEGSALGGKAR
jgi:hypothetical protein